MTAAPLFFDEQEAAGVDDDFFPGGDGYLVGTLDVGVNVVLGRMYDLMGLYPDFEDHIRFDLPAGLEITAIALSVTSYDDAVDGSSSIALQSPSSGGETFDGPGTIDLDPFTIAGSPIVVELDTAVDPESPEVIWFDSYTYQLSVTVAYVPEPTTIATLGLGLAGLAGARRPSVRRRPRRPSSGAREEARSD